MAGDTRHSQVMALHDNIHRLEKELEIAKGVAEVNHRAYERCGVINRALRGGLKTAKETIRTWHGEVAWDEYQVSPEMTEINSALGLTPSKAEDLVAAMRTIVDAAVELKERDKARYATYTNREATQVAEHNYAKAKERLVDAVTDLEKVKAAQ